MIAHDLPGGTPPRAFYGWTLVAVFWVILLANLAFPMYGGAVLIAMMAGGLGFSHTMLGLPFAVFLGVVGLGSPLVSAIIVRFGAKATLIGGNVGLCLGAALMATVVRTPLAATAVFGLIVGAGVAAGGNLTAQTVLARWFNRWRARAFALMLTASAIGGFTAPLAVSAAVEAGHGWQAGWWLISGGGALAALLAWWLVRETPADIGQQVDGRAPAHPAPDTLGKDGTSRLGHREPIHLGLGEAMLTLDFWVAALASASATGAFGTILAHGVAAAVAHGYTVSQGAFSLSLLSIAGLGGKALVIFGKRPGHIWSTLMLFMTAGLALAAINLFGPTLYVYSLVIGLGFGGVVACQPAFLAHRFGAISFPQTAGATYFIQAIAGIAFPWLAGVTFDQTGQYRLAFAPLALMCAVSSGLLLACSAKKGA